MSADSSRARTKADGALQARINAALKSLNKDGLVELALALCNTPNPLGYEDEIAQVYHKRLQRHGLTSRLQTFAPNRSNVIARCDGSGGGCSLMFIGHLESGPYDLAQFTKARIIDDEWISGVGIWNMKGALAAYLAAVSAVREAGVPIAGDISIAAVAGTHDQTVVDSRIKGDGIQGYSIGTLHLLSQGAHADMAVVGEPTSFKLVQQHFGMTALRVDISVSAARPNVMDDLTAITWPKVDAVEFAIEVAQVLRNWIGDYKARNVVGGVEPWVFMSGIEGGAPWSPYPAATSTIFIFVGTPPHSPSSSVLKEIRSVLGSVRDSHSDLKAHAEVYFSEPGPFVPDDSTIVRELRASHTDVFGEQPATTVVPWHSDASPLMRFGIPAVNYGPAGKFERADGRFSESVRIRDLVDCARVYTDLIVRVCT